VLSACLAVSVHRPETSGRTINGLVPETLHTPGVAEGAATVMVCAGAL
jgi:hypothetical protein